MNTLAKSILLAAAGVFSAVTASSASAQDRGDDPQFIARDRQGNLSVLDDAAGFGREGQWTFSTDAALEFSRRTQEDSPATTSISVFPATDYFLIENLSVGGVIGVGYTKAGDTRSTAFKLGPRVGYNFELSPLLSVWPKLGFSYSHTKVETERETMVGTAVVRTSAETSNDAIALNLFAPIMLHPAPHFFAGFGPFLDVDLSGNNRATIWGFRLTLGGWL